MVGTAPTFFRVCVTERLLRALERGSYPDEETVVLKFVPPVPNIDDYLSFGMRPLENRRIVLQCFEGLKPLIVRLPTQRRNYCSLVTKANKFRLKAIGYL